MCGTILADKKYMQEYVKHKQNVRKLLHHEEQNIYACTVLETHCLRLDAK